MKESGSIPVVRRIGLPAIVVIVICCILYVVFENRYIAGITPISSIPEWDQKQHYSLVEFNKETSSSKVPYTCQKTSYYSLTPQEKVIANELA